MAHNRVVSFFKTPVFLAKEYFHRKPDPHFQYDFVNGDLKAKAAQDAATMRRDGIVILPGFFKGEQLQQMQDAFETAVAGRPCKKNPDTLLNTEFLHEHFIFLKAALDDYLLEVMAGYFQKRFSIGRYSAIRIMPTDAGRYGSFQWHHDSRGRQINVQMLMSPVSAEGQCMTYLKGSQDVYYDHYRGLAGGSRFEKDLDLAKDPALASRVVKLMGPAGTVGLFDSNGLHSGNRNNVEKRDTVSFNFASKRHFKKFTVRKEHLEALEPKKRQILQFNPHCEIIA
ncbi:MAG: phytanoyl-CoA dioxygenase family protein [Prosthecobacter sp.]|nr:phytanoyl-CoA dioxygenase family protein [Prosthecobacter sp.]